MIAVEQDTVEEVVHSGRDLIALCEQIEADRAPAGLRRTAIEPTVLLDELASEGHFADRND
jgi:hypothetical protein